MLEIFTFYSEDKYGQVKRINFSEHQRDSKFPVNVDDVHIWYDAIEQFVKIAYDKEVISTFKMTPGMYQKLLTLIHRMCIYYYSSKFYIDT